jgi:PPK2 family polyphosphate:nucleotide phosphotransferase
MKKMKTSGFLVRPDTKILLSKWPTCIKPFYESQDDYKTALTSHIEQLSEQQNMLYASDSWSLLLIFQAMDAAGKDSMISHVMSGINPQGCQVHSFKHPSSEDLDHDFLWNTTRWLPERGHIGIFNRSYYEEVLIVRVHRDILAAERLPKELMDSDEFWKGRYDSIVNLEKHLHRNGTRIVKFFLHLSKEEQRRRFLKRIDEPDKNWKFSLDDVQERRFWPQYREAYEKCLGATSTRHAPWYIVPADDKSNARLIVSEIILDTFREMKLAYPKTTAERRRELRAIRKQLAR